MTSPRSCPVSHETPDLSTMTAGERAQLFLELYRRASRSEQQEIFARVRRMAEENRKRANEGAHHD